MEKTAQNCLWAGMINIKRKPGLTPFKFIPYVHYKAELRVTGGSNQVFQFSDLKRKNDRE